MFVRLHKFIKHLGKFLRSPKRYLQVRADIESLDRGLRWATCQAQFQSMLDRRAALVKQMKEL